MTAAGMGRGVGLLMSVGLAAGLLAGCGSNMKPPEPASSTAPSYPTLTPGGPPVAEPSGHSGSSGPSESSGSGGPSGSPTSPSPVDRTLTVASFNALGSNHTAPGGTRAALPSGVQRTGGMIDRLRFYRPDIIGLQELQRSQRATLTARVGTRYGSYGVLDNSIMWRRSAFTLLDQTALTIPYFGGHPRRMPVVRLRLTGTSTVVTVIDVHNPASVHGNASRFRAEAVQVERAFVEREHARGRVVFLLGDFNDREQAFCPLAAGGVIASANPGSYAEGRCAPPSSLQIDWIFGAGVDFGGYASDFTTRDDDVSDHPFIVATATIRGRR